MISEYLELSNSSFASGLPQASHSPTPDAKRLHRRDGYVAWSTLAKLMQGQAIEKHELPTACHKAKVEDSGPTVIERSCRALYGYPSLWTRIPTKKGKKIMKIFSIKLDDNAIQLEEVQVEGQRIARFNQIKNMILT